MTAQEYFDKAQYHYDRCIKFINAMSQKMLETKSDFKDNIARTEFDMILQYVLLRTALADGKFYKVEGQFIDKITDNYDIINLFKDVPKGLNWEWIAVNQSIDKIKGVVDELKPLADKYIEDFIKWFAKLDARDTEFDLLEILVKELGEICTCFVFCDGARAEGEVEVAGRTVGEILYAPWKIKMDE